MKLTDFKVLTFDVVGTLIDFEQGILDYMRPIVERSALQLGDEHILGAYGRGEVVAQGEHPDSPFPPLMDRIYRVAANALGMPADDGEAAGFKESIPRWPAFPDSVEALRRLRQRYRLVAVTNSDNWALAQFSKTLGEPFDDLVTAEMAGASKPDPRVFHFCLERQKAAGFAQSDILHVAQSQYHDIGVAHLLGYATCWIERRMHQDGSGGTPAVDKRAEPDWHFATLAELADAVDKEAG
ncbi:MAG TPA: HAD-IA family hydrolase [Geminicoccus sp.]|jgi:putative hydrolase of the HAD superfamily|uniref:HAD-IA family hydrolase n=1 Tax=Geminicoccus sp. TaxID=2024832 RepID=UPI002E37103C|nr:HAD-IA family hydrolase [Geminicoccus sp.]HEX2526954.1 HAD-IA family hydrolase [Geminicoccus sp.]